MTKAVFRFIFLLFIIILYPLSEGTILCEEPDLDYIIEKTKAKQWKTLDEIHDSICLATSVYKELGKDGNVKKEVVTRKCIYAKGTDRRYEECLFMSVNGRKIDNAKMQKEFEDSQGDDQEMRLPLTPEGEGHYDFYLAGSDVYNGLDVWLIDFKAKERKSEFVNGRGYVTKDTFDVIRVDLAPAKISRLVKTLKISMTSAYMQGYWMPVKFEMDLEIKISFFYYKHIIIEETYSEYKLNTGFADSIFKSK